MSTKSQIIFKLFSSILKTYDLLLRNHFMLQYCYRIYLSNEKRDGDTSTPLILIAYTSSALSVRISSIHPKLTQCEIHSFFFFSFFRVFFGFVWILFAIKEMRLMNYSYPVEKLWNLAKTVRGWQSLSFIRLHRGPIKTLYLICSILI